MSYNPNRNEDGTFASGGGDQTGGSIEGFKNAVRDAKISAINSEIVRLKGLPFYQKNPKRLEDSISSLKNKIKFIEKKEIKIHGYIEKLPNTHAMGKDGFKTGKTKIHLGGTLKRKIDTSPDADGVKNHSIIDIQEVLTTIKLVWNELPDQYRDNLKELKIYNSNSARRKRAGAYFHQRKDEKSKDKIELYVHHMDQPQDIAQVLMHEIAHSIWHKQFEQKPEALKKFMDGVDELMEKHGGITDYVHDEFYESKALAQEIVKIRIDRIKSGYGIDAMTNAETEKTIQFVQEQCDTITQNETHSEAFSFMTTGYSKYDLHHGSEDPEIMSKYFALVEELHKS